MASTKSASKVAVHCKAMIFNCQTLEGYFSFRAESAFEVFFLS